MNPFSFPFSLQAGGPMSPQLVSPCEYSILWETDVACAVKTADTTSSKCTVQDPSSNFLFNLMPLYKAEGYEVKTSDQAKSYKVRACISCLLCNYHRLHIMLYSYHRIHIMLLYNYLSLLILYVILLS